MKNNAGFFGGIEAKLFDTRKFEITNNDLVAICEDFKLGKATHIVKEPNTRISHSNFIFLVKTTTGKYILKFSPSLSSKDVIKEFTINRFAARHKFPAPYMYASKKNTPYVKIQKYLATCYSYIDGEPLYLKKLDSLKIKKITAGIFRLNQLLPLFIKEKPLYSSFLSLENFHKKMASVLTFSKRIKDHSRKKFITSTIENLSGVYTGNRDDFIKKPLHTNITLANMLFNNDQIFFLDFSHIRIDYQLYDLAVLIASCSLFNQSDKIIGEIIKSYFKIHDIKKDNLKILNSFITFYFLKEYLKITEREKSIPYSGKYSRHLALYKSAVQRHKDMLIDLIKKYR